MTFLSKLNHQNIVKVLGYCFEDGQLFLIYEFMTKGSLDSHLFTKDKIPLPWKTRVQIAKGVAEGLLFLHRTQKQVDNFSIKIHQILLDKNFNAKISDFESSKLAYGDLYKLKLIDPLIYYYIEPINSEFEGINSSFGLLLIQIITGEYIGKIGIAKLQTSMETGEDPKEIFRLALDPQLPNVNDTTIMEAAKIATFALRCVEDPNTLVWKKTLYLLRELWANMIKVQGIGKERPSPGMQMSSLSLLGNACSNMDLTSLHEIPKKIGYSGDEGGYK